MRTDTAASVVAEVRAEGASPELLRRYEELQLRVTRFSAVEHELILARQRLDRQVSIHRRMQQFTAAALQSNTDREFAALTAESLVDIFEVEIGIFVPNPLVWEPDTWGVAGTSVAEAGGLVRHLILNRSLMRGTTAQVVPDGLLADFHGQTPIKQAMMIGGSLKDGVMAPIMISANTRDGARFYDGIHREDLDAYSILADQVSRHRASRQTREEIRTSLREKEALLKEVHHRVKNNLQVVTSLLRLEARRTDSTEARSVIQNVQGRVRAMALLHETIYRGSSFAAVDLQSYLRSVANESFRLAATNQSLINLELDLAPVAVEIGQATSCGLIVSELVSNALKHAFVRPVERGVVRLTLRHSAEDNRVSLRVGDNGVGLPANLNTHSDRSLGLNLIRGLVSQLGGSLVVGPVPLSNFYIEFPIRPIQSLVPDLSNIATLPSAPL